MKHWYNPKTWMYPRAYGSLFALVIFLFGIYTVADRTHKNKVAIEKSCILQNNLVIRASLASPRHPTIEQIKPFLVDCKDLANHPEKIKAEELPTP